jgi:hypothetical protein
MKKFFIYCHQSVDTSVEDLISAVGAGHGDGACYEIPIPMGVSALPANTIWLLGLGVLFEGNWCPPLFAVVVESAGDEFGPIVEGPPVVIVNNLCLNPVDCEWNPKVSLIEDHLDQQLLAELSGSCRPGDKELQ